MLRRINKRIQSDCIAIELFTIDIHGGGHLSHVHNIHIEICARIIFVQVNLQQFVAASNVNHLQGTLHVHAFVSPSAVKSQQLQVESSRELFQKKNQIMDLTHLSLLVKTVLTFAVSVKVCPFVLTYVNFKPTWSFSIPLYAKQSWKTRGLPNAFGWKWKGTVQKWQLVACQSFVSVRGTYFRWTARDELGLFTIAFLSSETAP